LEIATVCVPIDDLPLTVLSVLSMEVNQEAATMEPEITASATKEEGEAEGPEEGEAEEEDSEEEEADTTQGKRKMKRRKKKTDRRASPSNAKTECVSVVLRFRPVNQQEVTLF